MPTQDEELASLVDSALEGTLPEVESGTAGDDTEGEPEPEGEVAEGEEAEGEEAEGEEAEGEEAEGEEGDEPETRERDPATGKFKKVEPSQRQARTVKPVKGETPEQRTAREAAAKQPDPIKDAIPKDTHPATAARIRALVKLNQDVTAQRDAVAADFDQIINAIKGTGSSPQQYGEILNWMALFNSPNPQHNRQAYDLVESVCDRMAMKLGITRQLADPLAKHQDLVAAVANKQLTREYALQIATDRDSKQFNTELSTQATQEQQRQQQLQQATTQAKNDLTTLGNTLAATDADYDRKRAIIVPILKTTFARLHPSQWKQAFEDAYRNAVVPQRQAQRREVPRNQPARARGSVPNGGAQGEKSLMDVVNQALSEV